MVGEEHRVTEDLGVRQLVDVVRPHRLAYEEAADEGGVGTVFVTARQRATTSL